MSATTDFYLARADENAKAASETNLINVRARCLRAEAVWRQMADRLLYVEQKKRQDASAKSLDESASTGAVPWPITPITHLKKPRS